MADYHAVLMRTLEGLGETTPQLRVKLYERARVAISLQLEDTNPSMSAEAIATQKAHLEAAIASIESDFVSADQPAAGANADRAPAPQTPRPPSAQVKQPVAAASVAAAPVNTAPAAASVDDPPQMPPIEDDPVYIPDVEEDTYQSDESPAIAGTSPNWSLLIAALVGLLLVAGGGAALWANRASLMEAFNGADGPKNQGLVQAGNADKPAVSAVKKDEGLASTTTVESAVVEKFDQRLNADGQEVVAAPVSGNNEALPAGVEPSAVQTTRIVVPGSGETATAPAATDQVKAVSGGDTSAAQPADQVNAGALVAQKGFLYEESSARGQNTVDVGNVVWSVVREAPADGMPLEPAIRAKVEIGGRNLVLLVTIKRNVDPALPASHLIELVFSVPDDFIGGNIDKVQRLVFKESEEARGEALVGVPATIADGIFLIALNNLPQAVERNKVLMKSREWIDIPLGYRTGRRALITLEKGVPGERVFNQAFAAWDKAG